MTAVPLTTRLAALALAAAAPCLADAGGFLDALRGETPAVVRGQSSPYYEGDPFGGGVPTVPGADPFLTPGPAPVAPGPGFDPFAPGVGAPPVYQPAPPAVGVVGPQPYRYGWKEQIDVALFSPTSTSDADVGDFTWNELNFEKQWVGRGPFGNALTVAPQYNLRWLEGPDGPPGLSGNFHRLGLGLKAGTPVNPRGWAFEVGFTPAIATDFNGSLSSDAW